MTKLQEAMKLIKKGGIGENNKVLIGVIKGTDGKIITRAVKFGENGYKRLPKDSKLAFLDCVMTENDEEDKKDVVHESFVGADKDYLGDGVVSKKEVKEGPWLDEDGREELLNSDNSLVLDVDKIIKGMPDKGLSGYDYVESLVKKCGSVINRHRLRVMENLYKTHPAHIRFRVDISRKDYVELLCSRSLDSSLNALSILKDNHPDATFNCIIK